MVGLPSGTGGAGGESKESGAHQGPGDGVHNPDGSLNIFRSASLAADVALPDSSQTVIVKRADTTRPIPPKTAAVTTVTTEADTTLIRIVQAERNETGTDDLLREDAEKE